MFHTPPLDGVLFNCRALGTRQEFYRGVNEIAVYHMILGGIDTWIEPPPRDPKDLQAWAVCPVALINPERMPYLDYGWGWNYREALRNWRSNLRTLHLTPGTMYKAWRPNPDKLWEPMPSHPTAFLFTIPADGWLDIYGL